MGVDTETVDQPGPPTVRWASRAILQKQTLHVRDDRVDHGSPRQAVDQNILADVLHGFGTPLPDDPDDGAVHQIPLPGKAHP